MSKKYGVAINTMVTFYVEVEADSESEAYEIAEALACEADACDWEFGDFTEEDAGIEELDEKEAA